MCNHPFGEFLETLCTTASKGLKEETGCKMGARVPLPPQEDVHGLRESLHFPPHLTSIRMWPWAARGTAELMMLYLAGRKLNHHMYNYVDAVMTLGDKREILSVQKVLNQSGDLTGIKFTKMDQGEEYTVYLVHVGTVHFGDYRDNKYIVNHKYMALAHQGALYAMCLEH